jgi:NitT/TauT family transport system substrate-binding protein
MRRYRGLLPGAGVAGAAWIALMAMVASGIAQSPPPKEPTTVRVTTLGGATDAGLYLADEYGLFKEAGIALDMERLNTTSEQVATLAAGQVDVAGIAVTAGLFAAPQRGIALRVVGDKQSIRPGFSSTRIVVRSALAKASEADTAQDLKGKTLAGPARASFGTFVVAEFLKRHGMALSDVNYVELPFPSMLAALTNGAIDGAVMIEPFLSQALRSGAAKPLSDPSAYLPAGVSVVPLVYSESFAHDRARGQAFMTAYMQGVRLYNDAFVKGRDRDKIIAVIAHRANVSPMLIRYGFLPALDPNQHVDKSFLAAAQAFFIAQGMLQGTADIDTLVDASFAEAAVRELGEYH